jgi:hypothetical protein
MNSQTRDQRKIEVAAESLFRVMEFHRWVRTNVLFPTVPDSIVHPLMKCLQDTEHKLVTMLHDYGELERVTAIQKALVVDRIVNKE